MNITFDTSKNTGLPTRIGATAATPLGSLSTKTACEVAMLIVAPMRKTRELRTRSSKRSERKEDRAMAVARQLRSGQVKVNTTDPNPRAPFGGFKQSGDGREWGAYAFDDFVQIKAYNRPAPAE